MGRPTVFMFSGQGSHYYGMGKDLYASHPVFRESMQSLDAIFREMGGRSILEEIYRPDRSPADPFEALCYTHPAILMLELALLDTLRAEDVVPDCVLGASLGGFAAAAAAGVLTLEELARCIVEQVEIVETVCPRGGMLAIFGSVDLFRGNPELEGLAELAAINSKRHFVLSAPPDELRQVEERLTARGVLHQRLPVAYAFHSHWMDVAAEPFRRCLEKLDPQPPKLRLVSCETAADVQAVEDGQLWRMVRAPIRFRETVQFLERGEEGCLYVDLGPSGTLANFARQNRKQGSASEALSVLDPFSSKPNGLARIKEAHTAARASRTQVGVNGRKPTLDPAVSGPGETEAAQRTSKRPGGAQKMKAYLFPGQGSQKQGMGEGLFEEFPRETALADDILGYSIAQLCEENPDGKLDRTEFTQPALYVVNALSYMRKAASNGAKFFAGHSLGEYNALLAARAFDFETGLRLVQKRAALMSKAAGGGMAAVIGLDEATLEKALANGGHDGVDLANYNGAGQFIVSGPQEAVMSTKPSLLEAGARAFIPLRVSGAFHSRYMEPARQDYEQFLGQFQFERPAVPVISNVTGRPYENGTVGELLAEQLTRPVRWDRTVEFLLAQGELEMEELGPGKVLSGLIAKIRKAAEGSSPAPAPKAAAVRQAKPARKPRPEVPRPQAPTPAPAVDRRPAPRQESTVVASRKLDPQHLGSAEFRATYGTRYAYACGAMFRGTSSEEMVVQAAQSGVLSFFGAGGLPITEVGETIVRIKERLGLEASWGVNLVHDPTFRSVEDRMVTLFLEHGVRNIEASAFMQVTPALVRYRLKGLRRNPAGELEIGHRIMGKVSRPEVAEAFLRPAPERIVRRLLELGQITAAEAELANEVPIADDLCIEADSGGHTDRGNPLVLLPTMIRLRDRLREEHGYRSRVRIGAAGGIGTPESAAAMFVMGADFILTGSINLCTVESGMSAVVKDMLQGINIQDTDYAPAGDMFELGAEIQVMKRGVFFPARAKKLYDLYRHHESLEEIDPATRKQIEERYFHKSFDEVWQETRAYFHEKDPEEIEKAEKNPRHKMALVFRWYFGYSQRLAMFGEEQGRVDFQVHCGPALGAFNQWVRGTPLESWRTRTVGAIAERLMSETAQCLEARLAGLGG